MAVAVVPRPDHQVGQDPAVPGDAAHQPGRCLGCLLLHGVEGGCGGHGVVVLLPGEVLQCGGLLLLLKVKRSD